MKKKVIQNQQYDNYWKLTVEYSNINGNPFRDTLKLIVLFIDENEDKLSSSDNKEISKLYQKLQDELAKVFKKKDLASVRKSINQFIKLGFIKPKLRSYHRLSKRFINANSNDERELIFSEVYYSSASFNSSFKNDFTERKEINFLLKTLMYHPLKKLNERDIISLMNTDVESIKKGYLTIDELNKKYQFSKIVKFEEKKYNQIKYFYTFLKLVPGIIVSGKDVMYKEDASDILSGNIDTTRDQTLFRIMKENLKRESREIYGGREVCYFTKMETKGLVTSHIWRLEDTLKEMDVESAYDYKNALLLEQNVDAYFDKYDLSFNSEGIPMYGKEVSQDFRHRHIGHKIDDEILNIDRLVYLEKHREKYFQKKLN